MPWGMYIRSFHFNAKKIWNRELGYQMADHTATNLLSRIIGANHIISAVSDHPQTSDGIRHSSSRPPIQWGSNTTSWVLMVILPYVNALLHARAASLGRGVE